MYDDDEYDSKHPFDDSLQSVDATAEEVVQLQEAPESLALGFLLACVYPNFHTRMMFCVCKGTENYSYYV